MTDQVDHLRWNPNSFQNKHPLTLHILFSSTESICHCYVPKLLTNALNRIFSCLRTSSLPFVFWVFGNNSKLKRIMFWECGPTAFCCCFLKWKWIQDLMSIGIQGLKHRDHNEEAVFSDSEKWLWYLLTVEKPLKQKMLTSKEIRVPIQKASWFSFQL